MLVDEPSIESDQSILTGNVAEAANGEFQQINYDSEDIQIIDNKVAFNKKAFQPMLLSMH